MGLHAMRIATKLKHSRSIFVLTFSSSILLASSCAALDYRIDCRSVFVEMGAEPGLVRVLVGSTETEVQQIADTLCKVGSVSEEKVEFLCPYLLPETADNPEGLGPFIVESQNNLFNNKANLINVGELMGECASMEIE